jgi:hypothetical protein
MVYTLSLVLLVNFQPLFRLSLKNEILLIRFELGNYDPKASEKVVNYGMRPTLITTTCPIKEIVPIKKKYSHFSAL